MITSFVKQCLKISLYSFGFLQVPDAIAQVTPDNTTNTQVDRTGNISEITGGETRGSNLFHSFQEFSVGTGNEAFFNNSTDIGNIFSRVTGGNVSNINGTIRANGGTNLFLINPAGIVLGEGSSLDIGGSFYGSSASSILFEDGEFSATDLENQPLLTVNAPIGLNFRNNPGEIVVRSTNINLSPEQDLNLIGGAVNISNSNLRASEGTVNLGAVSSGGTVTVDENSNFSFGNLSLADISLNNGATVNVNGNGGGDITVNARNLNLSEVSLLNAGINSADSTSQTQGGDISVNVTETITLSSGSFIFNNITNNSFGNGGNINLNSTSTNLRDRSSVFTDVGSGSEGNAGDINIVAGDRIILENSTLQTNLLADAVGSAGDINITANSLLLTRGTGDAISQLLAVTRGEGNGGNITIDATDVSLQDGSSFITQVEPTGVGNAGDIVINTENLSLTGGTPSNSSAIIANTFGIGNAGDIRINATGSITANDFSRILSQAITGARGNGGNINVIANSVNLNRSDLITNTTGEGNAGSINVEIAGEIKLDRGSLILSQVRPGGIGEANDINITTGSLELNNSEIIADSSGLGSSGNINITAEDTITLQGLPTAEKELGATAVELPSQIITGLNEFIDPDTEEIVSSGQGQAGNINITASQLNLTDLASISSNVEETTSGRGGEIILNVDSINIDNNSGVGTFTGNSDNAGSITVNGENLELASGSGLVTATDGAGNAGTINLNISGRLTIDNANAENAPTLVFNNPISNDLLGRTGLFANATERSTGNAGSIAIGQNPNLSPQEIVLANGAEVRVDSTDQGNAGNIEITTDTISLEDAEITADNAAGTGGNITINASDRLTLSGNSKISSAAINFADGGNVSIDTNFIVAFPGNNDILASAQQGQGGDINIMAESLFGIEERAQSEVTNDIDASSDVFGLDGTVTIDTPDINPAEGATEIPNNVIEPQRIAAQACNANVARVENNSLIVEGKGGIPRTPDSYMDSENIIVKGQAVDIASPETNYQPVNTSYGKVTPARGVEVTEDGIILTAYRTDNTGDRMLNKSRNCR